MNTAWSTVIDSLSGVERKTPQTWSHRKVHRMLDDVPAARGTVDPAATEGSRHRSWPNPRVGVGQPARLRCPCTACTLGLKND